MRRGQTAVQISSELINQPPTIQPSIHPPFPIPVQNQQKPLRLGLFGFGVGFRISNSLDYAYACLFAALSEPFFDPIDRIHLYNFGCDTAPFAV